MIHSLAVLAGAVVACLLGACSDDTAGGGGSASASGWNGRWRTSSSEGTSFLTLEQLDAGTVRVTSASGSSTARITAPDRAEGEDSSNPVRVTFGLVLRGDRLTMSASLHPEDGSTQSVPDIVFERVKVEAASGTRDARLVGHWRHTEARSGAGWSYALDVHLQLSEDGSYSSWNTDADGPNAKTTGVWRTEGSSLFLRPEGQDWHEKGAYSTSGTRLLLTYGSGDKQIFERL